MYIDQIKLKNLRSFRNAGITFIHPDQDFKQLGIPKPKLANVNLLLGNNGFGKTTLLKAVALACLGPAVSKSGIYPYRLIRREPEASARKNTGKNAAKGAAELQADAAATFFTHPQDRIKGDHRQLHSKLTIRNRIDLEEMLWGGPDEAPWHSIYSADSDAFFFVGYGASRRVEQKRQFDPGQRKSQVFARAQRIQSLFEDTYSLIPLSGWLPEFKQRNKGRFAQVLNLLNRLTGKGHYKFTGELENGEYLFERGNLRVPFPALSDGYRAFLGWAGDLLYHICMTCPSGKKLVENRGIVMIDEVDLHLHPKWQMEVLPTLAKALPNIQFIVTSHSPLIVGSLEWMNIVVTKPGPRQSSSLARINAAVHGLDADQVLLTDFFGLETTRAKSAQRTLKELTMDARNGDAEAAKRLLEYMATGMESRA